MEGARSDSSDAGGGAGAWRGSDDVGPRSGNGSVGASRGIGGAGARREGAQVRAGATAVPGEKGRELGAAAVLRAWGCV